MLAIPIVVNIIIIFFPRGWKSSTQTLLLKVKAELLSHHTQVLTALHGSTVVQHRAPRGCSAVPRASRSQEPQRSSLAGSLFFSVRRLELDPRRFGKPPAFLPSQCWGCKARGAWRLMEQSSHATPAEHVSQQAGVKMHRWEIHFRNFISGVPSS